MTGTLKKLFLSPVIATAMIGLPTIGHSGNESRSDAYDIGNGLLEVIADFSENAIYWCGAGDYALRRLSTSGNARLYVWSGPAPSKAQPGQRAVTFAFSPPPGVAPSTTFTTDVSIIGNSLTVAQAKRTCDERTSSG